MYRNCLSHNTMARYKPQDNNSLLLPVVLPEQIVPGTFAFALNYLVDNGLDLKPVDAQFKNDEVGASAYDPRVMLKIVLLAYSQGLISSRAIEQACQRNVQFIAISGDSQPSHTHIAKFVANLSTQIKPLFSQVLMTCDAQGLIGRDMFAIDGVKLPSNASKERSGTHAELRHRADRLDKAADKILALHQAQDKQGADLTLEPKRQTQMEALHKEAARTREFLASNAQRRNRKGQELKTNVTDPESAKMATSKGVIQGYAAQAAVDSSHQIIVAADALKPNDGRGRQVTRFVPKVKDPTHPSERMRQAVDSTQGRQLYSQRIGTVEPVFANIRHNKHLTRLNHRGRVKVNTQWNLYCMVHNIEKLAKNGYAQ